MAFNEIHRAHGGVVKLTQTGRIIAPVAVCLLLSACALSPVPQAIRDQAARQPSFDALQARTEIYRGSMVILGGTVIQTRNLAKQSEIEVLQQPLDYTSRPEGGDVSDGRFLIRCPYFLDPAIFDKGREVTVGGKVIGFEMRPLGEISYRYPTIDCDYLKLWSQQVIVPYNYMGPYYGCGWSGYYPCFNGWGGYYLR